MMRIANRFTDPKTAKSFDWPLNHDEEQQGGKRRNVTHGANTAQTGLVKHQGDDNPLTLRYSGTILTEAMLEEMWEWWTLCRTQTINFRDFAGDEYEVLFTAFDPVRRRAIRNPKDPKNAEQHFWNYDLELEIVRVISGPMKGVPA